MQPSIVRPTSETGRRRQQAEEAARGERAPGKAAKTRGDGEEAARAKERSTRSSSGVLRGIWITPMVNTKKHKDNKEDRKTALQVARSKWSNQPHSRPNAGIDLSVECLPC